MRHVPIAILLLAFLGLATLYSTVIPLGEGPDEPGHAAYVFFLARTGRLPVQRADARQSDVPGEGHQPPLAYALAVPAVAWLPAEQRRFDLPGNARFTWAGGDELNAVAHGSREYPPWHGVVLAWHLARLAPVLCGAVTVICTYLAALAALGRTRRSTAALAAALVALNPQFLFVSALVTNDALLAALSAVMLWLVLIDERPATGDRQPGEGETRRGGDQERGRAGGTWGRWVSVLSPRPSVLGTDRQQIIDAGTRRAVGYAVAVGAVLGLALLTKQSAVLLAPIALLGVAVRTAVSTRAPQEAGPGGSGEVGRRAPRPSSAQVRAVLRDVLLVLAAAAIVCGWWYARNWRLYGDPLGLAAFRAEFTTQPFAAGDPAAWRDALAQLHASFWGRFGWMNVPAPAWALWTIALIELLALAGLLHGGARLLRAGSSCRRRWAIRRWALLALPVLAFAWIVSFALTAGLVAWQGRLLFPALPAIAILLARGLNELAIGASALRLRAPRGSGPAIVVALLLGAIALWVPFGVIRPAYPFHTLPEEAARARIGAPVYGRFGRAGERGAELRGWRLEGPAQPGGAPDVVLIWHALARQNRDWTVFIHLVDRSGRIVAEDNRPPQDGAFPMTQWVAGDWMEDRHPLRLPSGLAPDSYAVRVGLYDRQGSDERAGVYDEQDELVGDYLEIGSITVS